MVLRLGIYEFIDLFLHTGVLFMFAWFGVCLGFILPCFGYNFRFFLKAPILIGFTSSFLIYTRAAANSSLCAAFAAAYLFQ